MPKTCPICGTTYPDDNAFCPADGTTLRADESAGDLIGAVIADRYLVSELLGEGGMGRVYLARHVRLPQQAAIKVLHPGMVKDQGAIARFNREAANAARIENERVARVFDFGETADGLVYLAMEYVPGRTLRDLLEEGGPLPPPRAANLVYQVAEGLEAAHRIGIVHRDLKPDNILVVTDEQGVDRCKVVDFGIAKVVSGPETTQLTQAGMLVGTPEFMSPEQVLGESLDGRSDVYSLALVAYQLFTGTLPFDGATPERMLTVRLIENPKPLGEVAPGIAWPDGLQQVLLAALDREPSARTASALEFGEALVAEVEAWQGAPVLRGRTPIAVPALPSHVGATSGATPTPTAARPTPAPTGRGATANVAAPPAASPTASPAAPPARSSGALIGAAVALLAVAVAGGLWWRGQDGGSGPAAPPAAEDVAPATGDTQAGGGDRAAAEGNRSAPTPAGSGGPRGAGGSPGAGGDPAGARTADGSGAALNSAPAQPGVTAPPPASAPAAVSAADALAARTELETLRRVLGSDAADEGTAIRAIPELQRLLPRLGEARDSAYAQLSLVAAYAMAGDPVRACTPLRSAKELARRVNSDALLRDVTNFANALTCAP
jgi:serine/threonine-protein kinase